MQNYNSQPKSASADQVDIQREVQLVTTRNFERITRACTDAMTNKKFVGIAGDPGLGKTTALDHFSKENPNTFIVTVKASMTPKDFWLSVFAAIHSQRLKDYNLKAMSSKRYDEEFDEFVDYQRTARETEQQMAELRKNPNLHSIMNHIAKNLNLTGGLLALDESGKFHTPKQLELLHQLRDDTMATTGIIMAGPDYFRQKLMQWSNKRVDGIPEILSRISYWKELQQPGKDEIKIISQAYGVVDTEALKEFQTCRNFRSLYNKIIAHLEDKAEAALLDNLEIKQTA